MEVSDDPTIAAYNKYAKVYDQEVINFWDNFPAEFIDKFITQLPGKRILNLGSGSGRDAVLLRNHKLEVVCLDASKAMTKITTDLGFESHTKTFEELAFPRESFDGVWAYTSLIHIEKLDAAKAISSIYSLLKASGSFAVGVIQGDTDGMIERKTMPDVSRYFKNYKRNELKKLVEKFGFTFTFELDYQPHNSVYLNQLYKKN